MDVLCLLQRYVIILLSAQLQRYNSPYANAPRPARGSVRPMCVGCALSREFLFLTTAKILNGHYLGFSALMNGIRAPILQSCICTTVTLLLIVYVFFLLLVPFRPRLMKIVNSIVYQKLSISRLQSKVGTQHSSIQSHFNVSMSRRFVSVGHCFVRLLGLRECSSNSINGQRTDFFFFQRVKAFLFKQQRMRQCFCFFFLFVTIKIEYRF